MKKLYFLFGIHNHQPVGNFPEVFDKAYEAAYGPFARMMEKHSRIKWTLHCTGILWDYFMREQPGYVSLVKKMAGRGQLEILTGGYYEPVLTVLPDADKTGQINKLTAFIKNEFGVKPRGIWLAERIWEEHLTKVLCGEGIEYTLLDDYHFVSAGRSPDELRGYFITEEQGMMLNVFPISQDLRYYIPWRPVTECIEYLKVVAEKSPGDCITMVDDGEKFGLWPHTYKSVWTDGWMEKFLTAIEENSEWLVPVTFSEFLDGHAPKGRVYLPTASYFEMTQWAMSPRAQQELEDVSKKADDVTMKYLRGGAWKNFMVKYPESNNMHKKMLYVSGKVEKAVKKAKGAEKGASLPAETQECIENLYAGQCNCAYWHGVFGGIYLPHLRHAIYEKLIRAENAADRLLKKGVGSIGSGGDAEDGDGSGVKTAKFDFDCDGKDEIIIETEKNNLYFRPGTGGCLFEWDIRAASVNILNVLTRRQEAYHRKLLEMVDIKKKTAGQQLSAKNAVELGLSFLKEENLDSHLLYDWYKRDSLIDHFLHPNTSYEDFRRCNYGEQGDFVAGEYVSRVTRKEIVLWREGIVWIKNSPCRLKVKKSVSLTKNNPLEVRYSLSNLMRHRVELIFAPEFNFAFSFRKNEDVVNSVTGVWSRSDEPHKIKVEINAGAGCEMWCFPIETVSLSEGGFEKTYQGTSVLPHWKAIIPESGTVDFKIEITVNEI
ncbi:MAG: alpha-amylase/4-alpha-glucanotransferase domain-containing protein [Elusimicrobiota bacterium]